MWFSLLWFSCDIHVVFVNVVCVRDVGVGQNESHGVVIRFGTFNENNG